MIGSADAAAIPSNRMARQLPRSQIAVGDERRGIAARGALARRTEPMDGENASASESNAMQPTDAAHVPRIANANATAAIPRGPGSEMSSG